MVVETTSSNLVAIEFFGELIEVAAPHARTQITGRAVRHAVHRRKDVALEDMHGNLQFLRIFLDARAVFRRIPRIHDKKFQSERILSVTAELLHAFGEQKGVLSAGNTHGDPVPGREKLVLLDALHKGAPDLLAEFFYDRALDVGTGHAFFSAR